MLLNKFAKDLFQLGGISYNINAENPTQEIVPIIPVKAEPKLVSRPLPLSIPPLASSDPKTGNSGSGIHIEIGGKISKGVPQKVPRMASTMKIHPVVSLPERSQPIMMPIAPCPVPSPAGFSNSQVTFLIF